MNAVIEVIEAQKSWKPLQPKEPEIMIDGRLKHSGEQLGKRIKALMKTHEIMDGSGHLILRDLHRPEKWEIKDVQRYVRAGLDEQNIFYLRKKVDSLVNRALLNLARPGRGKSEKPLKTQRNTKSAKHDRKPVTQVRPQGQPVRTVYVTQRGGRPYVISPGGDK